MEENLQHGYVQLQGPFTKDTELLIEIGKKLFNESDIPPNLYIEHIGIQSSFEQLCEINGERFEIGKTGILEIRNTIITSFKFSQNEPEETIVDCFLTW
jgi:hypothetical protein